MADVNYQIDSPKGLLTYLKTVESPVKIQKRGAEIILSNLTEHNVQLSTDNDVKLYMRVQDKETEETTIDDVVDLVCEYNFEEIYDARDTVKSDTDFVSRCRSEKRLEELERDKQILDKIFYHTKYGRKVGVVADRICAGLCEKLGLVPIYNIPMYEDKYVSEPAAYEVATKAEPVEVKDTEQEHDLSEDTLYEEDIADDHIVVSEVVETSVEPDREEREETKGAR